MCLPQLGNLDLRIPEPAGRRRGRRSAGWLGVFTSVGIALGGFLTHQSDQVFVVAGALFLVSAVTLSWARLWLREAREPFPFTFSVGEFEQRSTGFEVDAQTTAMLGWLSRDLISNLSNRVGRLSLREDDDSTALDGSHVHVSGWFGIRRSSRSDRDGAARRWQLEIVPQVRLGGCEAPAKLGQVVRYDLGEGRFSGAPPTVDRDRYDRAFEQVYWSVASEVYRQIGRAVQDKIKLLPPGRLRAAAYLYEADDYAASNTLDAYAAARDLYLKARRAYDVSARPRPATHWRRAWRRARTRLAALAQWLRRRLAKASRRAARREVLLARAELGEAKMRVLEWHLKQLCGSPPGEIYTVVPLLEQAIGRLEKLPLDVEDREEHLYRGRVVLAMTRNLLDDEPGAKACIEAIRLEHPRLARDDPEFFFVAGLNQSVRLRSQRLLGQAVALGPKLERAHFHRALRSDHVWRSRPSFEADVARGVDREYQEVVSIDPGNLSAWAKRGYMAWLLAGEEDGESWRETALTVLEAGRQYKKVRSEAIVAELDWNLARIAAEAGDFPKAYQHYSDALSAQLGNNAFSFYSFDAYFYENAGEALVKRFKAYRKRVRAKVAAATPDQERLARAVLAFACNDCGMAFEAHLARSGDKKALDLSIEAFEEAIEEGDSAIFPAYNLARLHLKQAWEEASPGQVKRRRKALYEAAGRLDEVLRSEPDWMPAQLTMVGVQAEIHGELATELDELSRERKEEASGGQGSDARARRRRRQARIAKLSEECEECRKKAVDQLRSMLPHPRLSGHDASPLENGDGPPAYRIDLDGSDVAALVADGGIRWREEFNQLQVRALIEWASALSGQKATAQPAFELCDLLRRMYHHSDERLLIAHGKAAEMLTDSVAVGDGRDPEEVVEECSELLIEKIRSVLEDDPAHYRTLTYTVFEWLPGPDRRDLLLKARKAGPSPLTLLSIANRLQKLGDGPTARSVLEDVAGMRETGLASEALLRLGELQADRGKDEKAIFAYSQAARKADSEAAPEGGFRAMKMLAEGGRRDEAVELASEVAEEAPAVGLALGRRLRTEGGWEDGARAVLEATLAGKPGKEVRRATDLELAKLLEPTDSRRAKLLREATRAKDADVRAESQLLLAPLLLDSAGDRAKAELLLHAAIDSGGRDVGDQARLSLARLLADRGERGAAEAHLENVVAEGEATKTTTAASTLAAMLTEDGDPDGAATVRADAAARHTHAAFSLAQRARADGDRAEARRLCKIGADHKGDSDLFAADCRLLLAELLAEDGEDEEAERAYWQVIDSGDVTVAPGAIKGLGEHFERSGRQAADAYRDALAKFDDVLALTVAHLLRPELESSGREDLVAPLYLAAAGRGGFAAMRLGAELAERGDRDLAVEVHEQGLRAGEQSVFREENMLCLAELIGGQDPERAKGLLEGVIASGSASERNKAEVALDELLAAPAAA